MHRSLNRLYFRFADRDMMMRYLGIGVGHLQRADFPHEVDSINPVPEDTYVEPSAVTAAAPPQLPAAAEDEEADLPNLAHEIDSSDSDEGDNPNADLEDGDYFF